jgi:hypothetical protein
VIKNGLLRSLFAILLIVSLTACGSTVDSKGEQVAGLGVFSKGYRMGQLSKLSTKGLWKKSLEGTMMLGVDSTPYSVRVSEDVENVLNPWHFSVAEDNAPIFNERTGDFVWIRYNQAQVGSVLYDTAYLAQEIAPVTKVQPSSCSVAPAQSGVKYSEGVRIGRVVKASFKGNFDTTKTWEIIFQEGNAGAKFLEMSITDEGLYNCAVEWLKSGLPVKISYTQVALTLSWNKTDYRVYAIKPAPSI